MANETELNEMVNPTSNTAITTLVLLSGAGYEQATAILEKMGAKKEAVIREVNSDDMMRRVSDIVRELRYVALNRTIDESGFQTLLDLPCGYTPKVFEFTDKGMHYIGCDLPAVINDFTPIIDSIVDENQKKRIDFVVVDVTNYGSMKAAADKAEGPVCIATEGLTVYLNPNEKFLLMQNIRKILSEKGGCWLNADVETLEYYMAVFRAVDGEHAGDLWAATSKIFTGQSDTNMRQNASDVFSGKRSGNGESLKVDYEKIEAEYKKAGFVVEKVPYYRDDFKLHLYGEMSAKEISDLRENIKHVNIWKITPDPDFSQKADDILEKCGVDSKQMDSNLPFEVKSELSDGVFTVSIQGRLDSITSPELLKQFQKAGNSIEAIHMDASRLEYISSAGLRVLHMMHDSLMNKDNFEITGCQFDLGFG